MSVELEGWGLVVRAGGYSRLHVHPGWSLSGVYYVDAGDVLDDRPDSGLLEFVDPRPAAETDRIAWLTGAGREVILPRPGLLVIFPSWLAHYVNPYQGIRPRVSIAFNARIKSIDGQNRVSEV